MDVRLSEEQQLIAGTAARLGAQHAIAGGGDLPPTPDSVAAAWRELARAELIGLGDAPAEHGGTAVAAALVVAELAKALCPVPYLGQGVLAPALLSAAGAATEFAALSEGLLRYCILLQPDLSGFAAADGPAVAFDALGATHGLSVDAGGVLRRHRLPDAPADHSLDRTRRTIRLDALPAGDVVGSGQVDPEKYARVAQLAAALLAADQVGLMDRALSAAVRYAGERRQFGRPIGSNQALAHLLADAKVLTEAARSATWHAAWALDAQNLAGQHVAGMQAKAFCAQAGREVVEAAVQAHGGIAVTWEHPLHLLLRRQLFDAKLFGDAPSHHEVIAGYRLRPNTAQKPAAVRVTDAGVDFADTAEEAAFRWRLREWLTAHAPAGLPADGDARMAALHDWHQSMAAAGWIGLSFAREYGGQGMSLLYDAILGDELAAAGAPPGPAINHITNAIRLFGTEEQKRTHLPGMLDCTVRWCQGFSEPGAGSDLASLQTRGSAFTGDDGKAYYRIDGQKLWTSEAVWADWCLLLLRTETDGPKHQQLSMLMLAMDSPGIECRPVKTAYGSSEFAEVFLAGAVVPAGQLLGRPGQGWEIAMALLGFERGPADMGWTARLFRQLTVVERRVRDGELPATPVQRQALARAWTELEALRLQVLRSTCQRLDGSAPGPEGSLDKLLMTRVEQRLLHVLVDVLGADAVLDESLLFPGYVWSRAQGIFGGTQQIQRDIVAQRVLGLPRPGAPSR